MKRKLIIMKSFLLTICFVMFTTIMVQNSNAQTLDFLDDINPFSDKEEGNPFAEEKSDTNPFAEEQGDADPFSEINDNEAPAQIQIQNETEFNSNNSAQPLEVIEPNVQQTTVIQQAPVQSVQPAQPEQQNIVPPQDAVIRVQAQPINNPATNQLSNTDQFYLSSRDHLRPGYNPFTTKSLNEFSGEPVLENNNQNAINQETVGPIFDILDQMEDRLQEQDELIKLLLSEQEELKQNITDTPNKTDWPPQDQSQSTEVENKSENENFNDISSIDDVEYNGTIEFGEGKHLIYYSDGLDDESPLIISNVGDNIYDIEGNKISEKTIDEINDHNVVINNNVMEYEKSIPMLLNPPSK